MAREIPKIALAPNLDLFSVPSIFIIKLSFEIWSKTDLPTNSLDMILLIFDTAFNTPFPW